MPDDSSEDNLVVDIPDIIESCNRKRKADSPESLIPAKNHIIPSTDEPQLNVYGRHASYPNDLNKLILPMCCNLCNRYMASLKDATNHYNSRLHDRKLTIWLQTNYSDKKLTPPNIKRFYNTSTSTSSGSDVYCEHCDLKLTSLAHAQGHYSGRKHRLAVEKNNKSSCGPGFYKEQSTQCLTQKVANDQRFGIGEAFLVSQTKQNTLNKNEKIFCNICHIYVSSASQMKAHESGAKHERKLVSLALDPNKSNPIAQNVEKSIYGSLNESKPVDNSDISMYRTPTGAFYCQNCNLTLTSAITIRQHVKGKKHFKRCQDIIQKLAEELK